MSVNQRPQVAYGLSQPDFATSPMPISADRNPLTSDFAAIGTLWINMATNNVWVLTSVVANTATWTAI
jgi:hypothetical protein